MIYLEDEVYYPTFIRTVEQSTLITSELHENIKKILQPGKIFYEIIINHHTRC